MITIADVNCLNCRKAVTMKNPKIFKMKNGRKAKRGVCPYCAKKVVRIIG